MLLYINNFFIKRLLIIKDTFIIYQKNIKDNNWLTYLSLILILIFFNNNDIFMINK